MLGAGEGSSLRTGSGTPKHPHEGPEEREVLKVQGEGPAELLRKR